VVDSGTQDPDIYEDPEKFNAWRYLQMREQPGNENRHQFVTIAADNLGFGLGLHACPGRFFASNEIKIILCFLLVEFDWRYGPGQGRLPDQKYEASISANPATMVQAKKRNSEIDMLQPMA
jgi:cytochrome P450